MKNSYISLFFAILLFSAEIIHAEKQVNLNTKFNKIVNHPYGVIASSPALDDLAKISSPPKLSHTGKSLLTVNKTGFDVLDNSLSKDNWLIEAFFEFTKGEKTILDIGCGYGGLSLRALSRKNKVVANDIAAEHLIETRSRAIKADLDLQNLFLNNRSFPYETEFSPLSFDAVLMHRVIHFLSPNEIENGLSKIHAWLKSGGRLYIVVMAPQNKSFSDWFLPIYEDNWKKGNKWPGTDLLVEKALPSQSYNLPKYLHVMDERPLRHALEKYGFKILKADFIDMKHFGNKKDNRDGKEAFAIEAVKIDVVN